MIRIRDRPRISLKSKWIKSISFDFRLLSLIIVGLTSIFYLSDLEPILVALIIPYLLAITSDVTKSNEQQFEGMRNYDILLTVLPFSYLTDYKGYTFSLTALFVNFVIFTIIHFTFLKAMYLLAVIITILIVLIVWFVLPQILILGIGYSVLKIVELLSPVLRKIGFIK